MERKHPRVMVPGDYYDQLSPAGQELQSETFNLLKAAMLSDGVEILEGSEEEYALFDAIGWCILRAEQRRA